MFFQVEEDQYRPDQVVLDQARPDQARPDQEPSTHALLVQFVPGQVAPAEAGRGLRGDVYAIGRDLHGVSGELRHEIVKACPSAE